MIEDIQFKPKILIVDDRVDNLVVLERVLDDPNYKVIQATSGKEALERMQVEEFACVLLDVNMPGMDGYEVAKAMREAQKSKELPILFVTAALRDDESLAKAYLLGAVDFLYKPLVPEIVRGKVAVFTELFKKRKLLEQKIESIERLAGGVACDFNSKFKEILTACNTIMESGDGNTIKRQAELILRAAEKSAGLAGHLLAFSRKQELETMVVNLNDIIEQSKKLLEILIGKKNEIEFLSKADLWRVKVDLPQFEQVIFNLVINAKEAMPEGGKITIQMDNVDLRKSPDKRLELSAGPYVKISVEDTGKGMDQDTMDKIFEPFFSTKEKSFGTGLGLSMVQGIVKQSGGDILVESNKGEGSRFEIFLPSTMEKKSDLFLEVEKEAKKPAAQTLLLVEDEDLVREVVATMLERSGFHVMSARSASDAIDQLESHGDEVDLMITDLVMPGMSGIDLAKRVKKNLPQLKIIYMSGYPENVVLQEGLVNHKSAYLQKPLTPVTFLQKVKTMLGKTNYKPKRMA